MLPYWSYAVAVTSKAAPAVVDAGALTTKWSRAAGVTPTVAWPVLLESDKSVTVTVWLGVLKRVTPLLKVWLPASPPPHGSSPGSGAGKGLPSLELKWMVPA